MFLHRVVVSSFLAVVVIIVRVVETLSSLDEVKSRESELNASPPTFTKNVMIHVCVLLGKTTNKSFPPKNKKKHLFLSSLRAFFFVPISPFCAVSPKNRRKIEKYLRFGNGKEERMSSKPSARKQNTRKKKEKRTRANKKHTNACT